MAVALAALQTDLAELYAEHEEALQQLDDHENAKPGDPIYDNIFADVNQNVKLAKKDLKRLITCWRMRAEEIERDILEHETAAEDVGVDLQRREFAAKTLSKRQKTMSDADRLMYLKVTDMLHETRPIKDAGPAAPENIGEEEDDVVDEVDVLVDSDTLANDPTSAVLSVFDKEDDDAESVRGISDTEDAPSRVQHDTVTVMGCSLSSELIETLQTHQLEAVAKMLSNFTEAHGTLLAHGTGTGKTLTTLAAISAYMTSHKSARAIVVCMKTLLLQWYAEIERWESILNLKGFVVVDPSHLDRVHAEWRKHGCGNGVLLLGPELFRQQAQSLRIKDDTIVVADEAHLQLKSDSNLFFKAFKALPTTHRILMTGTPIQNSLTEYYNMLSLIHSDLLGSKEQFRAKFDKPIDDGAQADADDEQVTKGKRALKKLSSVIAPAVSFQSAAELLTDLLPKKTEVLIMHSYEDEDEDEDDEKIGTFQKLSLLRERSLTAKVGLIMNIINAVHSVGDERIIVFSQRIETLKTLNTLHPGGLLIGEINQLDARNQLVEHFRTTSKSVLYVSLSLGGIGLHLPEASRVILADVSWNPTWDTQAVARAFRIGQENEVRVYRLCAKGTIEQQAYELSIKKSKLASTIVDDNDVGRVYSESDLASSFCDTLPEAQAVKTAVSLQLQADDPVLALVEQSELVVGVIDHDRAIAAAAADKDEIDQDTIENEMRFDRMKTVMLAIDAHSDPPAAFYEAGTRKLVSPMPPAFVDAASLNDCAKTDLTFATTEGLCLALAPSVTTSKTTKEACNELKYMIYRLELDAEHSIDPTEYEEDAWELVTHDTVFKQPEEAVKVHVLDPIARPGIYAFACRFGDELSDDGLGPMSTPSAIVAVE